MAIEIEGRFFAGIGVLDSGIDQLQFIADGAGLTIVSGSGRYGGLASFTLNAGGATLVDTQVFDGGWVGGLSDAFTLFEAPGGGVDAAIGSVVSDSISVFSIAANGQIGALGSYGGLGSDLARPVAMSGDADLMAVVDQTGALALAARDGTGALTGMMRIEDTDDTHVQFVRAVEHVIVGGADVLIVGDAEEDGITSFVVSAGTATMAASIGKPEGVGIMDPTDIAVVEVMGESFVVVASAQDQNGALTVFRVGADGALTRTDHVMDNAHTRFGGVVDIATVEVDGRQYIAAGGADDGVSLFVMLPNGMLQYLDTIVNNWVDGGPGQVAIANVSALAAGRLDDQIRIIVASQAQSGLSDLSWDVSGQGFERLADAAGETLAGGSGDDILVGRNGDDVLTGGAGADILVDGGGSDALTGGAGADVFVLRHDGLDDVILDFDPNMDRLDLSSWPFFYDANALTITPNANGAEILWRDERLVVRSDSGGALSAAQLRNAVMKTADRSMDLSGYDFPDDPGGEDPGGGDTGGGDTGGGNDPETYDIEDTAGDDQITGTTAAETILIGAGDDVVHAGGGNDRVDGGSGRNRVYLDAGNDVFDDLGLSGTGDGDEVYGGAGNDCITTGSGTDTIDGGTGDDVIHAGDGNDDVTGGAGSDEVYLGAGNDRYADSVDEGPDENDIVFGGMGNDYIVTGGGDDQLYGEEGSDTLGGKGGDDLIDAGNGDDRIYGASGNDEIYGRAGIDLVYGGVGHDIIDGGAGSDELRGEGGNDLMRGGDGDDWMHGGADNDKLTGGMGNDVLIGDAGNDKLHGEAGIDVIKGDQGRDVITGGAGNDRLYGGGGNDVIRGGADKDRMFGHAGDDRMIGEGGRDVMFGHAGRDRLFGGAGNDRAIGGHHNDALVGNEGDDVLIGQKGNDRLVGNQDQDKLYGGAGNDRLLGGNGDDRLIGGGGNDLLVAGRGADTLIGGPGRDRFIFTEASGDNVIHGYNIRQDRLVFRGIDRAEVSISKAGPHVTIEWDDGSVVLVNHDGRDFWFDDIGFN